MKINKKITSIIVFTAFIVNIMSMDIAWSQTVAFSPDKLSPVLKCNDLLGVEHRDYFRIQFALKPHLESINKDGRFGPDTLKHKLGYKTSRENTVFYPSEVQFFYNEADQFDNGDIKVMCRIVDADKGEKLSKAERTRTYYLVISYKADEPAFSFKEIYTEKEYEKVKGKLTELTSRTTEDKNIIKRYSQQNESVIDEFIQKRIVSGDFAEIEGYREKLGWREKFPEAVKPGRNNLWPEKFCDFMEDGPFEDLFSFFGRTARDIFSGKNIIFVKVPVSEGFPEVSLKIDTLGYEVSEEKEHTEVTLELKSHTSQQAVYVLLDEKTFNDLSREAEKYRKKALATEDGYTRVMKDIMTYLVHEAGVIYGLEHYFKDGRIMNDLDRVWDQYKKSSFSRDHFESMTMPMLLEVLPELRKFSGDPVKLDTELAGRDYLMGKKNKINIKVQKEKRASKQKANKRIFDAFKEIFTTKPNSSSSIRKGNMAVKNFLRQVANQTGSDTLGGLLSLTGSEWFNSELDSEVFRRFLSSAKVENYISNIWNVYEEFVNEDPEKHDAFYDLPQRLFLLLRTIDSKVNEENAKRDDSNIIGTDYVGFYKIIHALLYGGYGTEKIVNNFEKASSEAVSLIAEMRAKDVNKLRKRMENTASDELKEVMSLKEVSGYKGKSVEEFLRILRGQAAGNGLKTELIDESIVLAAEADPRLLAEKIKGSARQHPALVMYLEDIDINNLGITTSIQLAAHLKERSEDLKVSGHYIDGSILDLASSNIGDLFYIDRVIKAQSYTPAEYQAHEKEISGLVSDIGTLKSAAGILAYLTKYPYAEIYILASFIKMLRSDLPSDLLPESKDELLSEAADKIYGMNSGMTSLMEVVGGEEGKEILLIKMSRFVPIYVEILSKRGDYAKAEKIAENYLRVLGNLENKESLGREIDRILDLLNETYVNSVAYNISNIYSLPEDVPLFDKRIQDIFSGICDTHKKREKLWNDRNKPIPTGAVGINQALYALVHFLPENKEEQQRNYAAVLDFFQRIDLWVLIEGIEKDPDKKVSLKDLFNLYIYAAVLNEESFMKIERSDRQITEYCIELLFGEERSGEALKKIFPERGMIAEREKGFIKFVESMKTYYYQNARSREFIDIMSFFSRYASHQIRTVEDKNVLKDMFSEDYQLELYLLSKVTDTEELGSLFDSERSFIEYFSDKLYGEGNGSRMAGEVLGGEGDYIRLERALLGLLEIMHSEYYELNDVGGMDEGFEVYRKFLEHQKKTLKGRHTLKDIMQREDISMYYYALLLDPESMDAFALSGLNFLDFAGRKLFGEEDALEVSVEKLKIDRQEKGELRDPDYGFIDMYSDYIKKAITAGEKDVVLNTMDIFMKYLEHQKKYVGKIKKEYLETVNRDLVWMRSEITDIFGSTSNINEALPEALDLWERTVIDQKEKAEYFIRKEQEQEQAARKQKEIDEKKAEEEKRNARIRQLKEQRVFVENVLGGVNKKLDIARNCLTEKRFQAAEELINEASTEIALTDDFIKAAKKAIPELEEDMKPLVKSDIKYVDAKQYELGKTIKRLRKDVLASRDELLAIAEEMEKEKQRNILAEETLLREGISKKGEIEKVLESILDEAANTLDLIDAHRLVDARDGLKKMYTMYEEAEKYLEFLQQRMLSLSGEWRKIYIENIEDTRELIRESGEVPVELVENKILEEEIEERANLSRKWEQVENGIREIKEIVKQVYSLIKEKKLLAAGELYRELTEEKLKYHLTPIEGYLSLLDGRIDEQGRTDLEPLRQNALETRKEEVEQCVETLGAALQKETIAFEKELKVLKLKETEICDKAESSLKAIEDPAKQAMSHAKGLVLDLAEAVLAKSEKHFTEAGKQIRALKDILATAEGDRKEMLEEDLGSLMERRKESEKLIAVLTEKVGQERETMARDEEKKKELENKLKNVIDRLEKDPGLIGVWELEQVEEDIRTAEEIIKETEEYLRKEGIRTTGIIGPRKKQLLGFVLDIRKRKLLIDEKIKTVKPAFDSEKKKAEEDLALSRQKEQTHHDTLSEISEAREAIQNGDLEAATRHIDKAGSSSAEVGEYIQILEKKVSGKEKSGRDKWISKNIERFTLLLNHQREKIDAAVRSFDLEKEKLIREQRDQDRQEAALKESIDSSGDIITGLEQGNIRGVGEWLRSAGQVILSAEAYIEVIEKELTSTVSGKNIRRKKRLSDRAKNLREYLSELKGFENNTQRLLTQASSVKKTDEAKRAEIEDSLQEITKNMDKAGDAIEKSERSLARHYMSLIEEEMSLIKNYLSDLGNENASGKRKLLLAKNKLEVNRSVRNLESDIRGLGERYGRLELEHFLDQVRAFSVFSAGECPDTDQRYRITGDEDPLKLNEKIDYISFFRDIFHADGGKEASVISFNAVINALLALLDLGDKQEKYIEWLKNALKNDKCSTDKKAAIHAALFRNDIDAWGNYRAIQEMMQDADTKTEIIIRGLFLEMGFNEREQIDYLSGIMDLDDDAYEEKGLTYLDEAWISSALLFKGIDAEENIEWFLDGIRVINDMRAKNQVDPEFETHIYYSLIKYSLINKYAPLRERSFVENEIQTAVDKARLSGLEIPTNLNTRYTLIVPSDIFNNGEIDAYQNEYSERFNIETIGTRSERKFVNKVYSVIKAKNDRPGNKYSVNNDKVVVLVPSNVPDDHLKRFIKDDIRFIRIAPGSIDEAKMGEKEERIKFHRNTFAIMLLSRMLDADRINETYMRGIIETYEFYVKSYFDLDGITPEDFTKAVARGDLAVIVKALLRFRPMEKYDMPKYDKVQETLIFA